MANVLIAEGDLDVRALVEELLCEAGHTVVLAGTLAEASTALLVDADTYVVLLDSYLDGDYLAAVMLLRLAYEGTLYRHTFILLSTDGVFRLPQSLQLLRGLLSLPVVVMPFDVDTLLREVERAATRRLPAPPAEGVAEWLPSHNGHGRHDA